MIFKQWFYQLSLLTSYVNNTRITAIDTGHKNTYIIAHMHACTHTHTHTHIYVYI